MLNIKTLRDLKFNCDMREVCKYPKPKKKKLTSRVDEVLAWYKDGKHV